MPIWYQTIHEVEFNNTTAEANFAGVLSADNPFEFLGSTNYGGDPLDYFYVSAPHAGSITYELFDKITGEVVSTDVISVSAGDLHTFEQSSDKPVFEYIARVTFSPNLNTVPDEPSTNLIDGVPQYTWTQGCVPTGIGSILGYWDLHGYHNLFSAAGDEIYYTSSVEDDISSPSHNAKFGDAANRGWGIFDWIDHPWKDADPDSIAGFVGTSEFPRQNGWTPYVNVHEGVERFVQSKGYLFDVEELFFHQFTWDDLKNEIDAGRPVLASTNVNSGIANHTIPIIGYHENGTERLYYYYTNYYESETDYDAAPWQSLATSGSFSGIDRIWTITPGISLQDTEWDISAIDEDGTTWRGGLHFTNHEMTGNYSAIDGFIDWYYSSNNLSGRVDFAGTLFGNLFSFRGVDVDNERFAFAHYTGRLEDDGETISQGQWDGVDAVAGEWWAELIA